MKGKKHSKRLHGASRKGSGGRAVEISVKVDGRKLEGKLHEFLGIWKDHIRDEIEIHKKLLEGKRDFKKHLNDTVEIHEKFIRRIKKL